MMMKTTANMKNTDIGSEIRNSALEDATRRALPVAVANAVLNMQV